MVLRLTAGPPRLTRSACEPLTGHWQHHAAAADPRRALRAPKFVMSPPAFWALAVRARAVLAGSARNWRVVKAPGSCRDGVMSRNSRGPEIGRRCAGIPAA